MNENMILLKSWLEFRSVSDLDGQSIVLLSEVLPCIDMAYSGELEGFIKQVFSKVTDSPQGAKFNEICQKNGLRWPSASRR